MANVRLAPIRTEPRTFGLDQTISSGPTAMPPATPFRRELDDLAPARAGSPIRSAIARALSPGFSIRNAKISAWHRVEQLGQ